MQVVLVLPGLVATPDLRTIVSHARALARLVAAAGPPLREPEGLGAMLAPHYAIARQADWPLAPLRLAALGVDVGDAYWLAADPVSLEVGRDDVRVGRAVDDLAPAQADALIDTLNRHFAQDGLLYCAPAPNAWFVRAPTPPRLVTHPLDAAAGRTLRSLLPEGPDAPAWRRWLAEAQMLLHGHPVNEERERSGRSSVNSVWYSGGGTLPARERIGTGVRTWANGGIATALAMHATPARALPENLAIAIRGAGGSAGTGADADATASAGSSADKHVVAFDAPLDLAHIEAAFADPAWRALVAGQLEAVTLIADGAGDALAWTARRPTLLQRIRRHFVEPDLGALMSAAGSTR